MQLFNTIIEKFKSKGEKTGWTYIVIPSDVANAIKPGTKKSFRAKGKLDQYCFSGVNLLPMGEGEFIMPLNAAMRKGIGKRAGSLINVQIEFDPSIYQMNPQFLECLKEEPEAEKFFSSLTGSHQRYFSKWIDAAKTEETRAKRIAQSINGFLKKQNFSVMMRSNRKDKAI